jgi:hypothetical protein
MVCIGSGVLITRHRIYWKPGFFAPFKYSADLSEIEEFIYEYNNPRREKTYDMYLRRKNGTLLDALEGSDRINHFSKHHTNFLNEVIAFLQSNP